MKVPSPWSPTGERTKFFRRRSRRASPVELAEAGPSRRLQRLDVLMASMSARFPLAGEGVRGRGHKGRDGDPRDYGEPGPAAPAGLHGEGGRGHEGGA